MNKKKAIKITVITVVALFSFVLLCVTVYLTAVYVAFEDFSRRDYILDDMEYELTGDKGTLIIRPWQWLVAYGADVYYKPDRESESVYLGEVSYPSDYEVSEIDEDTVCVTSVRSSISTKFDLRKDDPLIDLSELPWGLILVWFFLFADVVICGTVILRRKRKKKKAVVAAGE